MEKQKQNYISTQEKDEQNEEKQKQNYKKKT